uniref:Non-specific lipid-transfer protein n=1 Tax=Kalanchoe fedtschenkoi TaxID=63787 RepID=A0A7N0UT94_KALFE
MRMAGHLAATLLVAASIMIGATSSPPPCETVLQDLTPCLTFLAANEQSPSTGCCSGVRTLAPYSQKQADRTTVCECLKSYAPSLGPIDMSLIAQIPKKCSVDVNLPNISSDIDCSKV